MYYFLFQGLDIFGFFDNFKKIREQVSRSIHLLYCTVLHYFQSKSRKVMKQLDDCGKRWEGWRFADQEDPNRGLGFHSCLWDCKEGFQETLSVSLSVTNFIIHSLKDFKPSFQVLISPESGF